jgi:Ca-activated chloride channel family protein
MNLAYDPRVIEHPWLLLFALVLPVLFVLLLRRSRRQRQARLARLGSLEVVRRLVPTTAFAGSGWRASRLGLAAALAGIALAGPRWGLERTTLKSTGVDMVIAVDASLSMLAADVQPNRLERAKQEIRRLRALSPGDRVGLLAFAGRSYVLSPITVDEGALDLFLDNLDPSVVGQAGSSLSATINQGVNLLSLTKSGADRALVIMSDGEAFELKDDVIAAAKRAAEQNVSIVTVGFGTVQGATIPIRENGQVTTKKDESGQTVITHYSPDLLQAAAQSATGTFIPAEATDKAARIKAALSSLRRRARTTETGDNLTPRFQWFLLPAILLLWLDTVLTGRRRRRKRRAAAAETALAAAVVGVFVLQGCAPHREAVDGFAAYGAKDYHRAATLFAQAAHTDHSPGTLYNLGTALLADDSVAAAVVVLDSAAEKADEETRYRARFNSASSRTCRERRFRLGGPRQGAGVVQARAHPASQRR